MSRMFSEMRARRADRKLPTAAIAAITPMTDEQLDEFVHWFNRLFERSPKRLQIVAMKDGKP